MKQSHKLISLFLILTLFVASITGCEKEVTRAECPFTTITWENTLDDIIELEGDYTETYDSTYGGVSYVFPKQYDGLDGTVKYSFDDKDHLVAMSWLYQTDDSKDLKKVYDKIHSKTEKELGKSGFKYNSEKFAQLAAPGDVWYLKDGNVILTTVDISEAKILQYTFLHPDVSQDRPE